MTRRHALTYVLTSINSPFHLEPLSFHSISFQPIRLHQQNVRSVKASHCALVDMPLVTFDTHRLPAMLPNSPLLPLCRLQFTRDNTAGRYTHV
jgi:hypothetical protein